MPEIKNTFSQGKMNKDLDERLVPNGQYRHAFNVDITSSENSDAGVIKNILGNAQASGIASATSQRCVGSIADERNNKLYWFVNANMYDGIFEFDQITEESRCVLVDKTGSVLKFSGAQITGINIIDHYLLFTDGFNEPKKVNLRKKYHENEANDALSQTHARLFIDDVDKGPLEEKHVTVIKIKPSNAPTIKINKTDNDKSAIFEKIFPRFCFRYKYVDGEYSAFGPFTEVVFSADYPTETNAQNSYYTGEPYNKAMTNLVSSIEVYDFVPANIPEDVVQVDILYKQEDSNVVYSVKNIKYTDDAWSEAGSSQFNSTASTQHKGKYIISSENIHAALPENQLLRPFDVVPKSALAQEIIGNRLVYGNYKLGYDFEDTTPGVNADIVLRQSQDFLNGGLKSIKSLRSYQLGVVLGDEYGRETPVFTSDEGGVKIDWVSEYGRNASNSYMFEANVNQDLPSWASYYKFYVKSTASEYYNLIMDKSYFPFTNTEFENPENHMYISFPSSDRNKIMEDDYIIAKKIYDGTDTQVYEGNKYKILDISNEAPDAVKYIFLNLGTVTNSSTTNILANDDDELPSLFLDPTLTGADSAGLRIDQETDVVHMRKSVWEGAQGNGGINGGVLLHDNSNEDVENLYMSWNKDGSYSERYKISSIRNTDNTSNLYVLKLSKKISNKDAKLAAVNNIIDVGPDYEVVGLDTQLTFKIERRTLRNQEDFSGKFFVKIQHASYLTGFSEIGDPIYPTSVAGVQWLYDEHAAGGNGVDGADPSTGIVNSSSYGFDVAAIVDEADAISDVTGLCSTKAEWQAVKSVIGNSFFIDDMFVAGSNPNIDDSWARESGQGQRSSIDVYRQYSWSGKSSLNEDMTFMGINSNVNWWLSGWGAQAQNVPSNFLPPSEYSGSSSWQGANTTNPHERLIPLRGITQSAPDDIHESSLINSVEGVVTTGASHTGTVADGSISDGHRMWRSGTIYTEGHPTIFNYDTTYGEPNETGKFFMHISFLAPGQKLHDGSFPSNLGNVKLQGPDSIAKHLQGIHGGGVFMRLSPGNTMPNAHISETISGYAGSSWESKFGGSQLRYVEFEGAYSDPTNAASFSDSPPSYDNPHSYGYDQDSDYRDRHDNQWNPWIDENGNIDEEIQSFCDRLKTPGATFRFSNDSSGTVFTIQSVQEKHLYNHTTWRTKYVWDAELNDYVRPNNSVEEAASDWASNADANGVVQTGTNDDGETFAQVLIDRITDFGDPSNRRTCYVVEVDVDPTASGSYDPRSNHGSIAQSQSGNIEFLSDIPASIIDTQFSYPTIWETEPLQLADLNIYYEASGNIPIELSEENKELFAPSGCIVKIENDNFLQNNISLVAWDNLTIQISPGLPVLEDNATYTNSVITFTRADGSYTKALVVDNVPLEQGATEVTMLNLSLDPSLSTGLNWFNCFSFGDGIESNRIRDGFNKMQLASGARASATLEDPFKEEHRTNSLIYSGLYNSNSALNNLNQFIAAEKITKDLNPAYGDIQKLFTRSTDLVAFCEDRVLKILGNKDALFNADGNPQLVSTNAVLGQAVPFVGDYGISKNPESFAKDAYRAYFTDKQRGAVLRLSMDGLTPISDAGMRDYFRDNLVDKAEFIGSFDNYNKHYNLTIKPGVNPEEVILEEEFNEGAVTESIITVTDVIVNGSFTEGEESDIYHTIAEISAPNSLPPNPLYNTNLDSSTTLIVHPEVPFESIQAAQAGQEGQEYVPPSHGGSGDSLDEQTIFGATSSLWPMNNEELNPWNDLRGVAVPGTARFIIGRYGNNSINLDSYYGGSTNLNYNSTWMDLENNVEFNGYAGQQYASGGDPTLQSTAMSHQWWIYPVEIFVEKNGISIVENGVGYSGPDLIAPELLHNSYHVSTTHKGITFRGTPSNGRFGYIDFPGGFLADPDTQNSLGAAINGNVHPDILEEYPGATDMTVFNGEEFQFTINCKANAYGYMLNNQVRVALYEGGSAVPAAYVVEVNPEGDSSYDYTANAGMTTNYVDKLIVPENADSNGVIQIKKHFRIENPDSDSDIAIQNFKLRIFVDAVDDDGNLSGAPVGEFWTADNGATFWHNETLGALGETVIVGMRIKKIREFQGVGQPYIEAVENQPSIPTETIDSWVEVQHNDPEHVTGSSAAGYNSNYGANLTHGNERLYGDENPGTVVTGTNADGQDYSYVIGTSNTNIFDQFIDTSNPNLAIDWPEVPVYPEPVASITKTVNGANSSISADSINSGFNIEMEMSQDLELGHWYLVDITIQPSLQGTIKIHDVAPTAAGSVQIGGDSYAQGGLGIVQEPELEGYGRGYDFIATSYDQLEYDPVLIHGPQSGQSIGNYRVLFKYTNSSYHHQNNLNNLRFTFHPDPNFNTGFKVRSINVLDVTDNNFIVANPSAWSSVGNQVPNPRAIINGTQNTGYTLPRVYKKDNKIQIDKRPTSNSDVSSSTTATQVITNVFQTVPSDGTNYQVNFSISENWLNELNLGGADYITANVYYSNDESSYNSLFTGTFDDVGDYSFIIPETPEDYNAIRLRFYGNGSGIAYVGAICAIDNVSLMQTVITFDPGNAGAWVISGFEQTLYDYVTWNNGAIEFNEAPQFSAISQAVELEEGATYEISFDMSGDIDGTLSVSYFNLEGVGFNHLVNNISEEGHVSFLATVGDDENPSDYYGMWGSFRLYNNHVDGSFTGIIDNVSVKRIYQIQDIDTHEQTVTFNEDVKGWVSFKSFIPENGLSLSNKYYTLKTGRLYQHDVEDQDRNTFYGAHEDSIVTAVLNQQPSSVKDFKTINYEGSQSKIDQYSTYDSTDEAGNPVVLSTISTYNLSDQDGWYSEIVITDQQQGFIREFIEKEGKWFNYIKGDSIPSNIDASKFNLQGLGIVQSAIANG